MVPCHSPARAVSRRLIPLIYIASSGRSGSTLLEMLLAAHSRIATVGELHLWPHELQDSSRHLPCGCGSPICACPFWREMHQRVDPMALPEPRIHAFREDHRGGKTLRWEMLADFGATNLSVAPDVEVYGKNNVLVLRSFLDLTEELDGHRPQWVVDSSKDPYRLLWLIKSNRFHITVLHLVRDPRGFVSSESRNRTAQGVGLRRLALRKSAAWAVQNHLIWRARKSLCDGSYLLIRYEDLAASPGATLQAICAAVGCDFEEEVLSQFRRVRSHAIGGNRIRHDDRPIVLDERWKAALPPSVQAVTQLVTWMTRRRLAI